MRDDLVNLLKITPAFQMLPMSVINQLASECELVYVTSGKILVSQDDPGDCLYIIQSGRLRAFSQYGKSDEKVLGDIIKGELIGELALFTESARAATVIAVRDSILWRLSKSSFDAFIQKNPCHIMPIVKSTILRLLQPTKHLANDIKVIALLSAGNSSNKLFIDELVRELTHHGKRLHLNSKKMQEKFPDINFQSNNEADILHSKIANWLSEQESIYQQLIYEVDEEYSIWTQLCLRQADKIILFGNSSDSSELNPIEKILFKQNNTLQIKIDFVLLHEPNIILPSNTLSWLKNRPTKSIHIKKNNHPDMQRLIRFIYGKEIALVFSGGGAKSVAQIGVYKALSELGIPIDRIGGTSMGALIAASIAMGFSVEKIIDILHHDLANNKKFKDYTIPTVALFGGKGWIDSMKKNFGETVYIEDLWRNFFCVASNFSLRKMQILHQGLLYKAVRASVSLPGIVPPISNENNELLIDGGIFNNLPIDVMRRIAPGSYIIGVRVAPSTDIRAYIPDGVASGLKRFLWRSSHLKHSKNNIPSIGEMISGSVLLCNDEKEVNMLLEADYPIEMDLSSFGLLDFSKINQLVEIGYQKTMENLSKNPINIGR